ncbi:beta-lactamase/transpeptidase-like protein [Cercophora newfieldiana]|uniref:Beta-lactamase/transpeptidase-like protein n=1 Tax=Cercophora newfieldiana TaxID=92897 RepID=A0AA40CJK1_9PEZI|nr:beta-lactamase/transpeptidase-like protein [Cercophora newfieldiana]
MSPFFRVVSLSTLLSFLAIGFAAGQPAYQPCPLLGALYPPPTIDKSSDEMKSFSVDFTGKFDQLIRTGKHEIYGEVTPNTSSFSVVLFSATGGNTNDDPIFYNYQYTAPGAKAKKNVSLNTVFPVGSLTQVFTVYAWLAKFGDEEWDSPITKFIPELLKVPTAGKIAVPWKDITIGSLASHMSGLARDSHACQLGKPCDRQHFIKTFSQLPPLFLPNTTPILSNAAFQLLAFALANKTPGGPKRSSGGSFNDVLQSTILRPLKMTRSFLLSSPPASNDIFGAGLNSSAPGEEASLSLMTSTHDLALLGSSILSSRLLPPSTTRRWLAPVSDTSNVRNGVGRPWEIYRAGISNPGPILNIFLKSGTVGAYSSYLGLSPDVKVGFAILAHDASGKAPDLNVHADIVAESIADLLGLAAKQAAVRYTGSFVGKGNDTAVEFKVSGDGPGLVVSKMVVGGKNVRAETAAKMGIEEGRLDFRLYPAMKTKTAHQFVAVYQDRDAPVDAGTPTCITWMTVGELGLGTVDRVVFGLDGSGRATSVEVPSGGVDLIRG